MNISQQFESMIESALRRSIVIFACFVTPTAVLSIARGIVGEWHPVFALQAFFLVVVLLTALRRKQLSRNALGGIIVFIGFAVGLTGLYFFGAIAPAGHWFIAIAIFYVGMLYSVRGMVVAVLILLLAMLSIAWLHVSGSIIPIVVPAAFSVAMSSWVIEVMCAGVFMATVLPTARNFVEANEFWMSDYERQREKIAHQATHDELTGLLLLRAAKDRLSMACNRYRRSGGVLAVLFIDLDGFKQVNDTYGHEAGDICLQTVAARLQGRLREQDTAARIGGDEFIVFLDSLTSENVAGELATELIALIRRPIDFDGVSLHIGASIGVALCPANAADGDSLLRLADAAMYRSKRAGSNGFVFADLCTAPADTIDPDGTAIDNMDTRAAALVAAPKQSMRKELMETIVNRCVLVLGFALSLTVLANVWRIAFNQAAPNLGATLIALALVLVLFYAGKFIALRNKLAMINSLGLLIALPGLFVSGLAGPAIGWCLAVSVFLVGIFYNRRLCLALAVIVIVAIMLSGAGFVSGALTHQFDVNAHALHPSRWLVFILAALAYSAMVLASWWQHKLTTARLIEESTRQIAELVRLATMDELTGLPLLRLANDRLEMVCSRALRAKNRAALLLVDLDGFKAINDSYGHEAGDHCLREVAKRMVASLRTSDTAARVGGDEFMIILDMVEGRDQVSATARRLIDEIGGSMQFGDHQFSVGATIGIALFPDHGTDIDGLRHQADEAMYVAKRAGKNRYQFVGQESGA